MIDYHCHLDLYPNPLKVFADVKTKHIDVLAVTTSPRAYLKASQYFSNAAKVRIALGFHPELISKRMNEWELFLNTIKDTKYIGEIGIDGSRPCNSSLDIQTTFFNTALIESEKSKGRIISIHSRGAPRLVLSSIERTISLNRPVLHWFTGTEKDTAWAVDLGCWFSINPRMCTTKQGLNIIRRIPLTRMLPETDGPFVTCNNKPCFPWDTTVYQHIARINNITTSRVLEVFNDNLKNLESLTCI